MLERIAALAAGSVERMRSGKRAAFSRIRPQYQPLPERHDRSGCCAAFSAETSKSVAGRPASSAGRTESESDSFAQLLSQGRNEEGGAHEQLDHASRHFFLEWL